MDPDLPDTRYRWTDAWLLLAAGMRLDDAPVTLPELLRRADGIQHAVAAFEEVDGGLARLVAAGLIQVRQGEVAPTAAGRRLLEQASGVRRPIAVWQQAVVRALGAEPWSPQYGPDDARRDPALPAVITAAEYDAAVRVCGYQGVPPASG